MTELVEVTRIKKKSTAHNKANHISLDIKKKVQHPIFRRTTSIISASISRTTKARPATTGAWFPRDAAGPESQSGTPGQGSSHTQEKRLMASESSLGENNAVDSLRVSSGSRKAALSRTPLLRRRSHSRSRLGRRGGIHHRSRVAERPNRSAPDVRPSLLRHNAPLPRDNTDPRCSPVTSAYVDALPYLTGFPSVFTPPAASLFAKHSISSSGPSPETEEDG